MPDIIGLVKFILLTDAAKGLLTLAAIGAGAWLTHRIVRRPRE